MRIDVFGLFSKGYEHENLGYFISEQIHKFQPVQAVGSHIQLGDLQRSCDIIPRDVTENFKRVATKIESLKRSSVMTSTPKPVTLPEIRLKKVNTSLSPSTACPDRIEKAKVMNSGHKGAVSLRPILLTLDAIKSVEVGPRVLRFLETPVAVIDLESGISGVSDGSPQKRKRER
jgi:hypothetical protein